MGIYYSPSPWRSCSVIPVQKGEYSIRRTACVPSSRRFEITHAQLGPAVIWVGRRGRGGGDSLRASAKMGCWLQTPKRFPIF